MGFFSTLVNDFKLMDIMKTLENESPYSGTGMQNIERLANLVVRDKDTSKLLRDYGEDGSTIRRFYIRLKGTDADCWIAHCHVASASVAKAPTLLYLLEHYSKKGEILTALREEDPSWEPEAVLDAIAITLVDYFGAGRIRAVSFPFADRITSPPTREETPGLPPPSLLNSDQRGI